MRRQLAEDCVGDDQALMMLMMMMLATDRRSTQSGMHSPVAICETTLPT